MSASVGWQPRLRAWVGRHLFLYLGVLVGIALFLVIWLAREDVGMAADRFQWKWAGPVLLLSLLNYLLRFGKWQLMLEASGAKIPWGSSARIYFSCFSMVVTPARLGELYKLVFLRRLHAISFRRSLPVLLMERLSDALALLALATLFVGPDRWRWAWPALVLVLSFFLAMLVSRGGWGLGPAGRLPFLRSRQDQLDEFLQHNRALLVPGIFGPSLALSLVAWGSECAGLWIIQKGLHAPITAAQAGWTYSASSVLGSLTFLPGGLGGTELSLVGCLRSIGVAAPEAAASTILVRAATLWFAVLIGVVVTLLARRSLRWDEVKREVAGDEPPVA